MSGDVVSRFLPVAKPDTSLCLLSDDHGPVWPIHSEHDERVLGETARLFGASLKKVPCWASRSVERPSSHEARVVALGAAYSEFAALYAHLTGRGWHVVHEIEDLETSNVSVVICSDDCADERLFDLLVGKARARDEPSLAGVIYGTDTASLRTNILKYAAAACLSRGENGLGRRLDILSDVPIGFQDITDAWSVAGEAADPDSTLRSLSSAADLLTISSHSDGVDLKLSKALTLCRKPAPMPKKSTDHRTPRCCRIGYCHRHSMPIRDADANGHLVTAGGISARLILADICAGVLDKMAPIDPSYRLIDALVAESRHGALVTSWKIGISSTARSLALANLCAGGGRIGEILGHWTRRPVTETLGNVYCLIGDPDLNLRQLPKWEGISEEGGAAHPPLSNASDYVLHCLSTLASRSIETGTMSAAREALRALTRRRPMESQSATAIIDFIASVGSWTRTWFSQVRLTDFSEHSSVCHCCKGYAVRKRFDVGGYVRDIVICARCGIVADGPKDYTPPDMSLHDDGTVEIRFPDRQVPKKAALILRSHNPDDTRMLDIAFRPSIYSYTVDLARAQAEIVGPTWLSLIGLTDLEITVATRPMCDVKPMVKTQSSIQ